jgi:phospholipid transport system substrate-binding protein
MDARRQTLVLVDVIQDIHYNAASKQKNMGFTVRSKLMRLSLFALFIFLAALPFSASSYAEDDVSKAKNFVESVATEAFNTLKSKKVDKKTQAKKLDKMIRTNVDIPWIGQFVMGRFWRQATDAQKIAYMKNYENFIATTYASRFTEYKGEGFDVTTARSDGDGKYTVKMSIKTESGAPMLVDYKIRKNKDGSFKIYDLNVEGVSLITTQRSEFSSILQNKGIDHLIAQLGNKTDSILTAKKK